MKNCKECGKECEKHYKGETCLTCYRKDLYKRSENYRNSVERNKRGEKNPLVKKECPTCGVSFETRNSLKKRCDNCTNGREINRKKSVYSAEMYEKNKESILKDRKKYYQNNKETINNKRYEWKKENWIKTLLYRAKKRAKDKGMEYDITEDDIIMPQTCPLLGTVLTKTRGEGHTPTNPSLDRIDNNKGYIKGNVQVISYKANSMKNSATKDELITFATNILKTYNKNEIQNTQLKDSL